MDFVASKLLNDQKLISKKNKIISRIYNHQLKAPDFLRFGIKVLAILFYLVTNVRNIIWKIGISNQILQSRNSRIQLLTNMIRFHDSLYEIANVNEKISPVNRKPSYPKKNINYDFLIIGSGPGGAVYASKLQKAGLKICMIESGILDLENNYDSFSYSEMLHKYKYGGINATLGNANIAYVEGQVIGGGSSVNSGLYHRAPTEILNKWETLCAEAAPADSPSPIILNALADDLNMPKAYAGLHSLAASGNYSDLLASARFLGLLEDNSNRATQIQDLNELDRDKIESLLSERLEAKKIEDFAEADRIRERIEEVGISIKDHPDKTQWNLLGSFDIRKMKDL